MKRAAYVDDLAVGLWWGGLIAFGLGYIAWKFFG